MKMKKLFSIAFKATTIFVCFSISILCYGEEAAGSYYKDIVFKEGAA